LFRALAKTLQEPGGHALWVNGATIYLWRLLEPLYKAYEVPMQFCAQHNGKSHTERLNAHLL
jgi:hypothetical protein